MDALLCHMQELMGKLQHGAVAASPDSASVVIANSGNPTITIPTAKSVSYTQPSPTNSASPQPVINQQDVNIDEDQRLDLLSGIIFVKQILFVIYRFLL
jgi:hypothetical protein